MVVFEALNALYGDCLLLRYKIGGQLSRIWIVDGGPRSGKVAGKPLSVWLDVLLPRLKEIDDEQPLAVALGMVSHVDDDHINGLERLTADLVAAQPLPGIVEFKRFWFNSFDAMLGPLPKAVAKPSAATPLAVAEVKAAFLADGNASTEAQAVLESIGQGIQLATNLQSLGLAGNSPVIGLVSAKPGQAAFSVDGASITVLGPLQSRLDKLRAKWVAALKNPTKSERTAALQSLFATDTDLDASIPNLSSIVVLVDVAGKSLLLTGDARGDDIVAAWKELSLPDSRRKLDVLKVPHHGSFANNPENFVRFFEATHYVFSANGKYDNPDAPVVEGYVSVHFERQITLHFTNNDIKWSKPYTMARGGKLVHSLQDLLTEMKTAYAGPWQYNFRDPGKHSIEIELPELST
ncbi:hypothetical protein NKI82_05540 [Mesorhizobium sp. M0482]|uniref:hypothetical protein n=1 Tax=Mesorhizobium sp. M0482 TaxID=2956948 RepID=UPI00333C94B6